MFEKQMPVRESIEKIALECREAGASEWETAKVVKALLQDDAEHDIRRLKKKAILELKQLNSKAAQTYASFNKLNVYVSGQRIDSFDRGNIAKSLLRETGIQRNLAEKIALEVEDKIKDLGLQSLNTALIREMADVKLLEYGLGAFHRQYARVGMPAHEVKLRLSEGKIPDGSQMLEEYNILNVLSDEARRMHFEADIHLTALQDYSTKPYAIAIELSEGPKSPEEAMSQIVLEVGAKMRFFSLMPSLMGLNSYIAGLGMGEKRLKEIACSALGTISALAQGRSAIFSVNLFSKKSRGKKERLEENAVASELVGKSQGFPNLGVAVCIDSRFQLKLLDRKLLDSANALFLQQNDFQKSVFSDGNALASKVAVSRAALNLERCALLSDGQQAFQDLIKERVQEILKCFEQRREMLSSKPYLKAEWIENGIDSIAIQDPEGAALALLGKDASRKEVISLSEKTIERLRKEAGEKTGLCGLTDKRALSRFWEANSRMREGDFAEEVQKRDSVYCRKTARNSEELGRLIEEGIAEVELAHN